MKNAWGRLALAVALFWTGCLELPQAFASTVCPDICKDSCTEETVPSNALDSTGGMSTEEVEQMVCICPAECRDLCFLSLQGPPICINPADDSLSRTSWFTGPSSYNSNTPMANIQGAPADATLFVTDAAHISAPFPGESSPIVLFGDTFYHSATRHDNNITAAYVSCMNSPQATCESFLCLSKGSTKQITPAVKWKGSVSTVTMFNNPAIPTAANKINACSDPSVPCKDLIAQDQEEFCLYYAYQTFSMSWWPAPTNMEWPNVVFYNSTPAGDENSIRLHLDSQRYYTSVSGFIHPFRNDSEKALAEKYNLSIGVYSGPGVDVCKESNGLQTDWSNCDKVRLYGTDTIIWDDIVDRDGDGVFSPVELYNYYVRQTTTRGIGFYRLDHMESGITVLGGCRLTFQAADATVNNCLGVATERPAPPDPVNASNVLNVNPNVLWHYGSKFTSIAAIQPDDFPASIFPDNMADTTSSHVPYAYFLGEGEICLNQGGCQDVNYGVFQPRVYLARIKAQETAFKAGNVEYYQGIDENGYSMWEPYKASSSQDGYANAEEIYDLHDNSDKVMLTPLSTVRFDKYGELWMATDAPMSGSAFFSSPDGIHWSFRGVENTYQDAATGLGNDAFFLSKHENAEVYGHNLIPAKWLGLRDTNYLYYFYSRWLTYYGFRQLPDTEKFPSYNVKLAKFKVPDPIPYLIPHDGYLTTSRSYTSPDGQDRVQTAVMALPFKGFFTDGSSANPGVKRNVVMQWCKCTGILNDTEESCKANACKPGDAFEPTNPLSSWKLGNYETRNANDPVTKREGGYDPLFNPQGVATGQILPAVPFVTSATSGDGQASTPVWNWATDTNTAKGASANVILRFSYYDVTKAQQTSDYIGSAQTQLKANLAKAPNPDPNNPNHWKTTRMLKLTYVDKPAPIVVSPPSLSYNDNFYPLGWRYYLIDYPAKVDYELGRVFAVGQYDAFTGEVIPTNIFTFTSDTPAKLQVLPTDFSLSGGTTSTGQEKYYIYGGTKTADGTQLFYESVANATTGKLEWRARAVSSSGTTTPVFTKAPVFIVDPLKVENVYLFGSLTLAGSKAKSDSGDGAVFKLENVESSRKDLTLTPIIWKPILTLATPLQYAPVITESTRTQFVVGGSRTDSSGNPIYQTTISRVDLDKLADAETDSSVTWMTPIATLPQGRAAVAAGYEPASGQLFVFGGEGKGGLYNDLLTCPIASATSTTPAACVPVAEQPNQTHPAARRDAVLSVNYYLKTISVLGGTQGGTTDTDIWMYNWETGVWSHVAATAQCGTARSGSCPGGYYCGTDQACHVGCSADSECASGQYCGNHVCTAFCSKDSDCATGYLCKSFTNGSISGKRCDAKVDPTCQGCTCDYLDQNGTAIDGCTGKAKTSCSTTTLQDSTMTLQESLWAALLISLPLFWGRFLRKRSRS